MTTTNETIATVSPETTEELLKELRRLSDRMDELNAENKTLSEQWDVIEGKLIAFHRASGLKSISGGGMSISFDPEAMRTKYDPSKFAEVFKWAADNHYEYIIQRRFTDAKILELIDSGVALPDGLSMEAYTKVSARRK
jgi:hypothetical protein